MADADVARVEDPQSRALRRLDWRFLVGVARDARLVHRADRALTDAARSQFADGIDLDDDGVAGRDASGEVAVLSDPSRGTLRAAFTALQPNGVCYAEFNRPWLGGQRRRVEQLHEAGFEAVETYWMWPAPRRRSPQFWVSLPGDGAIEHLLATRPRPKHLVGRVASACARAAWRVAWRAGLLAPVAAVGRRPSGTPPRSSLSEELRSNWESWGFGAAPVDLSYVVVTGGRSRLNKVVVLVFANGEPAPRLAIKLARVSDAETGLRREQSALMRVSERDVDPVCDIPRVVFCSQFAGTLAIGETPVIGEPIIASLDRTTHRHLAERVTDALVAFSRGAEGADVDRVWDRVIEPVLEDFTARFACVIGEASVDAIRRELEDLVRLPLPVVLEHRDCSPWNVVLTGDDRLGLLDWESAEPDGLPLLDLVYFHANAAFLVDGALGNGRESSSYRTMLDPSSPSGRIFADSVARYCRALDIDAEVVAPLRRFTWMVHAPGEHDRILTQTPSLSRADAAGRSVFAALFRDDVAEGARS